MWRRRWRDGGGAVRSHITRRRVLTWYLGVVLTLTALGGLLHWVAVRPTGLTRTFHADVGFAGDPLFQDRTAEVSLAFLEDDPALPRRFFSVEWRGYWFLPRAQTLDVYAGADDRVDVIVDGTLVLRRNFSVGSHTMSETVTLDAGAHEISIRYEQEGGDTSLNVQRAVNGEPPRAFVSTRLFPEQPDLGDFLFATGAYWLTRLVAVLWMAPIAGLLLVVAGRAGRRAWHGWRARGAPRTVGEFARRLSLVAFPTLLGPFVLLLLGPHTIYDTNRGEFSIVFADIAWPWLLMAVGGGWAILLSIGCIVCLLSVRLTHLYTALMFAVGVLLWAQGNLLVADYGLLFGEGLDLSRHVERAPYELALWVGGCALAAVFARNVAAVAVVGSQLLIALQVVVLLLPIVTPDREANLDAPRWKLPPAEIFELSRDRNVVHIVLDAFLSEMFAEVIEPERDVFDRDFSGFVFFADHLGAFPTTRASMPAMLTGLAYRNEMPLDPFVRDNIRDRSIFSVLAGQGYRVNSVTFHGQEHPPAALPSGETTVRYTIPTPYGSYRDHVQFATVQLLDLSLFRHVPHGVKASVYNEQAWLLESWYSEGRRARNARPSNHAAFLEEFADRMTIVRDEPVYTFIHVALPHPPYVVNKDCSFIGPQRASRPTYAAQGRCALTVVQKLFDRLRALGVYDRTVIVLTSDHGWNRLRPDHPLEGIRTAAGTLNEVAVRAMPLLAVKPAGSSGPLKTSYAPTAITDIPATILDLVGIPNDQLPGTSALQIEDGASRRRTYARHSWGNADWGRTYFRLLHVFSVDGRVTDPNAWSFQAAIVDPVDDVSAQLEQYRTGLFPLEQGSEGPFQWGDVHVVTYLPPDAQVFTVAARKAPEVPFTQTASLRIDGQLVGQHHFTDGQWHVLRYDLEARAEGGNPFCIEILVDPPWHDDSGRQLGLLYRDPP